MGLKFLDLFAGIGGFRFGMQLAGHTPVGWVEWDKFARKSYEAIHGPGEEWTAHDITRVTDDAIRGIGSIDVICGGFPCQAFSVAGKRAGFNDTRGTLFFEIMRFASILRPRYLFLENVAGLLNHENGYTFETILRTLDEVGYDAEWDVLNSKDFGVPQNRERVFIIGHLRGASTRKVFPVIGKSGGAIKVVGKLGGIAVDMRARVYGVDGIAPTLDTMQGGGKEPKIVIQSLIEQPRAVLTPDREEKRQQGRRFKEPGEPAFTVNTIDRHGVAIQEEDAFRIRKLTPRECFRLQGFPDWAFDRAAAVNSHSQLYKQAGNSVTVNVIHAIASQLY